MQQAFDFGMAADIARVRTLLRRSLGHLDPFDRLDPADQLVRSLIGSRTLDAVSWAAFTRLSQRYGCWAELADAEIADIAVLIAPVEHAAVKAGRLRAALRMVLKEHPDLDLGFLGHWPVERALAWLERLPGVGPKVAAAVLNFSTLQRPAFVVDTHVLRVLRRFGVVDGRADTRRAYHAVMASTQGWSAGELTELHALLKRLGQTACPHREPCCPACPLRGACRHARHGAAVTA